MSVIVVNERQLITKECTTAECLSRIDMVIVK